MKKTSIALFLILGLGIASFFIGRTLLGSEEVENIPFDYTGNTNFIGPEKLSELYYGFNVDSFEIQDVTIKRNESLSEILSPHNVSSLKIFEIASKSRKIFSVRKLASGKKISIIKDRSYGEAVAFIYFPNSIDYVTYDMRDSMRVELAQHKIDTLSKTIAGTINSSLYEAMVKQGGSPELVIKLSEIYAWAIDFFGLQKGDEFKIIYNELQVAGEPVGVSDVKASCLIHYDEPYYGFAYSDTVGSIEYYDEEGMNLRKNFLKSPLNYSRISSRFSYNRLHPVLKIRRPHLGVDYAAPYGTPVLAVGDGTVIKKGYYGGAGRMVKIRHNGTYTSGYLHLARYGKGVQNGTRVKQGQVIGYVGSSGLSTGPHLDFRYWKNGKNIDPLKVKPSSKGPLPDSEKEAFRELVDQYKPILDAMGSSKVLAGNSGFENAGGKLN